MKELESSMVKPQPAAIAIAIGRTQGPECSRSNRSGMAGLRGMHTCAVVYVAKALQQD